MTSNRVVKNKPFGCAQASFIKQTRIALDANGKGFLKGKDWRNMVYPLEGFAALGAPTTANTEIICGAVSRVSPTGVDTLAPFTMVELFLK